MTGWVKVNRVSEDFDAHWFIVFFISALWCYISAKNAIYTRIKGLENWKDPVDALNKPTMITEAPPIKE